MKTFFTLFFLLVLFSGCKKAIQKAQEDLVIKAMVDGQWKISEFTQNGNDITSSFATYKFQYYENKTVDAINNGTVEKTGTWDGNASTMTTSANFAGVVSPPLGLINGTWQINNSGWTYVKATQIVGTETKTMRLDKL